MSAVVSNTSPISNLAIIGRLDLLKLQFHQLWIPSAVERELRAHPDPSAVAAINSAVREQWIRVAAPAESAFQRMLLLHVHAGEAEAIALAIDLKADRLLIDEREGRELAGEVGLVVTGILGVLLQAKQSGQISAVRPEIHSLRSKARFFVSSPLEARVLAAAGE